jgi:hypothetical protein
LRTWSGFGIKFVSSEESRFVQIQNNLAAWLDWVEPYPLEPLRIKRPAKETSQTGKMSEQKKGIDHAKELRALTGKQRRNKPQLVGNPLNGCGQADPFMLAVEVRTL